MVERRARNLALLDAIDALPRQPFSGTIWRIVNEGRDPLQGRPAGARWDPGTLDVIYASLAADGARAEIFFHFSRQPVFPSKVRSILHGIRARTAKTLELADLAAAKTLGVLPDRYADLDYAATQAIGDAAAFLGFDGLLVPSARWACQNLVVFTERVGPSDLVIEESEAVDWNLWRREQQERVKRPVPRTF